ncbi:MAG: hypothetical protein KKF56_02715 [Nanoarchaeota archaeon]|nr:hypothetical protein [Nanoarchaeota archaeon]
MEIDIEELLEGTPRPHYLRGLGNYTTGGSRHVLIARAYFDSSSNPSVEDRVNTYPGPHANVGDFNFAVWNGLHIIRKLAGFDYGTLRNGKPLVSIPLGLIPPDEELDLRVEVEDKLVRDNISFAEFHAVLSNKESLAELKGHCFAGR